MKQYFFKDANGTEFGRVSRTMAKKAWLRGETVYFCPDRIRPDGAFGGGLALSNNMEKTFEEFEDEFLFYCCRPDTGLRIAFYAEVKP